MHNSSTEAVNQAQEAGVIHDHIEDSHNTLTTNGFHSFAENEARNENSPPDGAQDSGTTNNTLQSSGSGVIVPRTPLATNHAQPDSTNEETPHNESSGEASHSATESSEIHCRPSSLALAQPVPIMGYPNQQHPSSCPTPQPHNSQLVHHHSVYSSSSPYSTSYTYNNSEPGTPASSSLGTSAGWLHSYNPYVSGFPAVDFNGLLWGASAWPFAAAASGHPLTPNDMISPAVGEASSLTPSLAEVANHCYTQQGTPFSTATPSPTAATNQFRLPHSAFHTGATLDTTVAVDLLMTRNAAASTGLGVHNHHNHTMPRSTSTRKGGRRPREIEERNQKNLTDEDKDKRAKRRQRNKEAAARCRKRRLDQMVELQKEVEALKMEGQQYLKMVEQLQRERDQIAQQLSQHANCKIPNAMVHQQRQFSQNSIVPPFKNESLMHSGLNNSLHATFFKEEDELMSESSPPSSQYTNSTCNMAIMDTDNDPVISDAAMKKPKQEDMIDPPFVTRPNSLSFKNPSYDVGNLTNTPSHGLITPSMFEFNLLNQPTGLTPVANGPMPVTSTTMAPRDRGELRQL